MTKHGFFKLPKNLIFPALLVLLIFYSTGSYAQTPVDFSGVWIQDTAKSDDFYKSFEVEYAINQTLQTFTVKQTFTMKGSNESVIRDYSFTLDGKVTSVEKENGIEKNSAQWSDDKKTLITRSTVFYGTEEVGFKEFYSISDNGLVLTSQKTDIIPDAFTVKLVFNKKK